MKNVLVQPVQPVLVQDFSKEIESICIKNFDLLLSELDEKTANTIILLLQKMLKSRLVDSGTNKLFMGIVNNYCDSYEHKGKLSDSVESFLEFVNSGSVKGITNIYFDRERQFYMVQKSKGFGASYCHNIDIANDLDDLLGHYYNITVGFDIIDKSLRDSFEFACFSLDGNYIQNPDKVLTYINKNITKNLFKSKVIEDFMVKLPLVLLLQK
jgi:hypothetical protein